MSIKEDGHYFDGTLGGGGHSRAILEKLGKSGSLISVDRDDDAIAECDSLVKEYPNFKVYKTPFSKVNELDEIMFGHQFDGMLLDLGISSHQIDEKSRGFSFMQDHKLDMRMNRSQKFSAYTIINEYEESELFRIFKFYGEFNQARRLAKEIVAKRKEAPIETTMQLRALVEKFSRFNQVMGNLAKVFQAIRIEVNGELKELEDFLANVLDVLAIGGRVVIISYHSLEDRIVKEFVNENTKTCVCPPELVQCVCNTEPKVKKITRKPVIATEQEKEENTRSRSAKIRVFEKI